MTEQVNDLYIPVKTGFESDSDYHRRNYRSIENYLESPHITSAKVVSLAVDKLTAGTMSASVLLTGLIQAPAATGYRVEIGNATYPLRYWNGTTTKLSVDTSGNVVITGAITATSGSFTGAITATSGSITGNLSVTGNLTVNTPGLITAPASGYRVEIGNATYPLRYWDGATTKFAVDASGGLILTGTVASSGGLPIIRSNGYPRAKVSETTDQTIADSNPELLDWSGATTASDTDSFVLTASDAFNMTFTGQYMVFCQVRWEAAADGSARRLKAKRNGSDISELTDGRRAHSGAFPTTNNIAGVADFTAGDDLTFEVYQEAGANLAVSDWNAQIVFLGPD